MDLSSLRNTNKINNKQDVSFQGQKYVKDANGNKMFRVMHPYIELGENEEFGVEIVKLRKFDRPGMPYEWKVLPGKPLSIDTDHEFKTGKKNFYDINLDELLTYDPHEIGYRFVVKDKNTKEVKRAYTDSVGTKINDTNNNEFTISFTNIGAPALEGSMSHLFLDSVGATEKILGKNTKAGASPDEVLAEAGRTHANRLGGTIQDVIKHISTECKDDRYIMLNPVSGGGKTSSHMYHPSNIFKVSEGAGNMQDFEDLIVSCFKNNQNFIMDGAYTSQGYEGLQLNHALKWNDSVFKYWFKNPSETGYDLGVLSNKDNKHTGIRIVNPKGVQGYKYDPDSPTYIQFYDTRLAGKQLEDCGKLIETYDNINTDDPYELTNYQDSILNNYFEIDPDEKMFKGKAYGSLEEWSKKVPINDILNPKNKNYSFVGRVDTSGYTGWDGSLDLVKLNLANHYSNPKLKEGSNQVKNYLYNAARFWTEKSRDTLILNIADEIRAKREQDEKSNNSYNDCKQYFNEIEKKYGIEQGRLFEIYKNILEERTGRKPDNHYNYAIENDPRLGTDYVKDKILDFPLESLNFSPELLAVLSTPYITPRPDESCPPDASKNKILKSSINNKETGLFDEMQNIYTETIPDIIENMLREIDKKQAHSDSKLLLRRTEGGYEGGLSELTPYGKYFVEMARNDIMQFLITKALFKKDGSPVFNEKGNLDYTVLDKEKNANGHGEYLTLNRLKITPSTNSKDEARKVAAKLKNGLEEIKTTGVTSKDYNNFIDYLTEKYGKNNPEDYKIAEAIVDQTGSGLNWRFDAAKDVADWDEAKTGQITSEEAWKDVMNIWSPFVREIKKINDSSYIVGEVTSINAFDDFDWGKFVSPNGVEWTCKKPERVYYQEVEGSTTCSEYGTFFGAYPKLFGKNTEEGNIENFRSISSFLDKTQNFIDPVNNGHTSPEFIKGAHVFLDNHDKPKTAHLMAVDAKLFWSSFSEGGGKKPMLEYRTKASRVLGRPFNPRNMSSKATAVAEMYIKYFREKAAEIGLTKEQTIILEHAVQHLANGYKFKSEERKPDFNRAEAFGVKPFEDTIQHVLTQAETLGLKISPKEKQELYDGVRSKMVAPYFSKSIPIYEMMSGIVGIPTLFEGDELGQTGAETRSKNSTVAIRGAVRTDWLNESLNPKKDVIEFNKRIKALRKLGKTNGMGALRNGDPIVLNVERPAEPEKYITGLKNLSENDLRSVCKYLIKNADSKSEDELKAELDSVDKTNLINNVNKRLNELRGENTGLYNWAKQKIDEQLPFIYENETGGVYKYNDKGEGVITLMTNAFIDKDVNKVCGLKSSNDSSIKKPKTTEILLKDKDGNLIERPGTKFIRKAYDKNKGMYVDAGEYILTNQGRLVPTNGSDDELNETVTYFYKSKTVFPAQQKQVG